MKSQTIDYGRAESAKSPQASASWAPGFRASVATVFLLALFQISLAHADWDTQTINLQPGWNAVYLAVQPEPADSEAVFAGIPVKSVWAWNPEESSVQFVQDASTLLPSQPEWLTYLPAGSDEDFLTDLFSIRGGRAYLIHLEGGEPVSWQVSGRPVLPSINWVSDSLNLVGFHVDEASPPSISSFLESDAALSSSPVYRLTTTGEWALVANPTSETVGAGEAYWIFCDGSSDFSNPIEIRTEQEGGLEFGSTLSEQVIRVRNGTNAAKAVTLESGESVTILSYWDGSSLAWTDIPASLLLSIPAQDEVAIRLAIRRGGLPDPALPYRSAVEIRDGQGSLVSVAVTATPLSSSSLAGLWIGTAAINAVSQPSGPAGSLVPEPTASEMSLRLIVHVDSGGQARLLQHVTMMWKEGTEIPDPADPSKTIVGTPGEYVLITDDSLIPQFLGSSVRDDAQVGRRVSSAAFGFSNPVPLLGSVGGSLASPTILLDFDDPLNPFKHRYHPDHDNLSGDYSTALPEGLESFTVSRAVILGFTPGDPEGFDLPGWGVSRLGGNYNEYFTGLHKDPVVVQGTFRLHRASEIDQLNDGIGF